MKVVGAGAVAILALATSAGADQIYRWQDSAGRIHYSNTEYAGEATRLGTAAAPAAQPAPAPAAPVPADDTADADPGAAPGIAAPLSEEEQATFSTRVSLRRNALERELRATEKRIAELDARLKSLGQVRTRWAGGSAATGGVRTAAADVRSEEEQALAAEREQLAQHAIEVRSAAVKLRTEVSGHLGATPAWWADVR